MRYSIDDYLSCAISLGLGSLAGLSNSVKAGRIIWLERVGLEMRLAERGVVADSGPAWAYQWFFFSAALRIAPTQAGSVCKTLDIRGREQSLIKPLRNWPMVPDNARIG